MIEFALVVSGLAQIFLLAPAPRGGKSRATSQVGSIPSGIGAGLARREGRRDDRERECDRAIEAENVATPATQRRYDDRSHPQEAVSIAAMGLDAHTARADTLS